MMDFDALKAFIEVARRGSFAAVARDRNVNPSSISRLVAALEQRLGLRLFQRTTRVLTLTEAGARYLQRVETLLDEFERARDEAASESLAPEGTLRLTASVAFGQTCLVPLLPEFRARFPALKLELLFTDATIDLVAERIDLALRLSSSIAADAIRTRLRPTRYRVCASPTYLQRIGSLSVPADLERHACLSFPLAGFRSRWLFRNADGVVTEVAINSDVLTSSALALRECARAGMGPSLLADWLVDEDIAAGRLVALFPNYETTATTFETAVWLVYPTRAFLPRKVRVTIDFLRERLAAK